MGEPNLMDVSFDLNVCQVERVPVRRLRLDEHR